MNRKLRIGVIVAAVAVALGVGLWLVSHGGEPDADAGASSALTVEVVGLEKRAWPQTLEASGSITAWQEVIVSPETGGLRVADLLVDVGATVQRGQLLARLADDSVRMELRKQEAALAQARVALEQATSNLKRAKAVGDSGALSEQQLEEYRINEATARASLSSAQADVDSTRLKLKQTRLVAPDDGFVSSKSAVLGNVVNAGSELFRLVRKSRVEWRPELDARQLGMVHTGQSANVVLPGGKQVPGKVREVGPTLSEKTGRAIVYVSLPTDSAARSGMFASGTIALGTKSAMTLPQSAIVSRDGRSYVFAVDAQGKVGSRAVDTGRRQGDRVEILTPIEAKTRIVASGGAFLSEDSQVTVTGQRQAGTAP
ncbi:efflux RND transporter periplasmic adaptor subunit [Lysobacter yangpyeongensis]|uniref:Efflux RND transporter periplasmic adaptor subunit n=1 Tax=Lysobacter yangpyeongensis TaxID=346182 RepID=A0ABW0SIH4_9GAMM